VPPPVEFRSSTLLFFLHTNTNYNPLLKYSIKNENTLKIFNENTKWQQYPTPSVETATYGKRGSI
jgi:hypothetical protein